MPATRRALHYVLAPAKRHAVRQLLPGPAQRHEGPVRRHRHCPRSGRQAPGEGPERHNGSAGEHRKRSLGFKIFCLYYKQKLQSIRII